MFKQLSPEQAGQQIVEHKAAVVNNHNWDVCIKIVYDNGLFTAYFRQMENPDIGFEHTYHQRMLPDTVRERLVPGFRFHWHDNTVLYPNGLRYNVTSFCTIPLENPLHDEFVFTNADNTGYERVNVSEKYL